MEKANSSELRAEGLTIRIETFEPDRCIKDLERSNGHNWREEETIYQTKLQESMAARWDLNGETIKYDKRGHLIDGAHRFRSCIKLNRPFRSLVVYGVEKDDHIDEGSTRKFWQWLKQNGVGVHSKQLQAALNLLFKVEATGKFAGNSVWCKTTVTNLIKMWRKHPDLIASVTYVNKISRLFPSSEASVLHYYFKQKDAGMADNYVDALAGEIKMAKSDPVDVLRERLLKDQMKASNSPKMAQIQRMALAILAWNKWRRGEPVDTKNGLRWIGCGPSAAEFPTIE